jgi:hypothetical protein
MRLRTKILLTILLATAWFVFESWAIGHDSQYRKQGQNLEGQGAQKADLGASCTTRVSQAKLLEWYANANKDYFDGTLPKDTRIVWANLRADHSMADTSCNAYDCLIRMDPFVNISPATAHLTELHEICHVYTRNVDLDHGPEWQNCMTMLFRKGALDGLI